MKKHRHLRKAAVLLASLDAENAQALLEKMSPDQAALLREAVEQLGPIDVDEQNQVLAEFYRIGPLVPPRQPSGIDLDGRLPRHLAVSSQRRELPHHEHHDAHAASAFAFLEDAPTLALADLLAREHPQTIAVVVSHLTSQRAAEVLAGLPSGLQIEVARRLVDLDETDPEILREVERGLETWLCQQLRNDRRRAAGMTTLHNILGAATPATKRHLLNNLAHHDRQLAGTLSAAPLPISFAELEQMDRASLSIVVRYCERGVLVRALAGASEDFAERAFAILSDDEGERLRRAVAELGPLRPAEIEHAQESLGQLAGELQAGGQIVPRLRARISVAV